MAPRENWSHHASFLRRYNPLCAGLLGGSALLALLAATLAAALVTRVALVALAGGTGGLGAAQSELGGC